MGTFRNSVVKLAFTNLDLRDHLVPLLQKQAKEFNSRQELEKYMREHPGADRRNHTVDHQDHQSDDMSAAEKNHARKLKETLEWAQIHVEDALSSRRPDHKMVETAFDKLDEKIKEAKKVTQTPKGKETLKFYQDEIKALRKGLGDDDDDVLRKPGWISRFKKLLHLSA